MDQQQQAPPPRVSLEEIVVWLDERKTAILGIVALIGVGGLVYVARLASQEGKEHRATAALFDLQMTALNATNQPTVAEYEGLLPKTEGTGIAQHVKLRTANALYAAGKFGEAQSAFERFVTEYPTSPLQPEAVFGVATCLEAQKKNAEALSKYQELASRFPQSAFVDRARLGQARLYELQGDKTQAFRIYQELASHGSSSMASSGQMNGLQIDAAVASRRLLKEDPALMQTNAPSASPVIAPTQLPATLAKPANLPKPKGS